MTETRFQNLFFNRLKFGRDVNTTCGPPARRPNSVGKVQNSRWFIYLIISSAILEQFNSVVSCDFSYGYDIEDFALAVINLSYIDPLTSLPKIENGEIGRFGTGKIDEVTGVVVHVTSNNHTTHDACDRLDTDNLPHEPFIALIQQGRCRDYVKLKHAAEGNASAAVVYSSYHESRFVKINHKASQRIAYVFIGREKGEAIASLLENGTRVLMRIGVASRNNFRYANINRTSVLFVSVSFIVLMLISMAWLVFYYVQRFRYILAKDMLSKRLCSAARRALDKIPVKTVKSNDVGHDGDYECCAICIEPLKPGEVVRILPCQHSFHKICVDPWLLEQRSCPMCKLNILIHFGLVYSGSQESVLDIEDRDPRRRSHQMEEEIFHVPILRRASSSQTDPQREDRATSPCSLSCLNPNEGIGEHSFIDIVDMSDVAVNTSAPPSDSEYEGSEVRLSLHFTRKDLDEFEARRRSRESLSLGADISLVNTASSPEPAE